MRSEGALSPAPQEFSPSSSSSEDDTARPLLRRRGRILSPIPYHPRKTSNSNSEGIVGSPTEKSEFLLFQHLRTLFVFAMMDVCLCLWFSVSALQKLFVFVFVFFCFLHLHRQVCLCLCVFFVKCLGGCLCLCVCFLVQYLGGCLCLCVFSASVFADVCCCLCFLCTFNICVSI